MGWFGKRQDDDDRALVEISNDSGDHIVIDIPSNAGDDVNKLLRKAGLGRDDDEEIARTAHREDTYKQRDHAQHRYRMERVVDEREDLEDSHDRENDGSDYEESDQPAWRWW